MALLDKKTAGDLVRLLIFIVVTTLATGLLVILIGNITFQDTKQYRAQFADATGVVKGDDVRIAGVKVGSVQDVEIVDKTQAEVTFKVAADTRLDDSTTALIRYRNLVGQRYISLTPMPGGTDVLDEGDTIPIDRTKPALDLTVLFNGFKPLFQALSPDDINKLSYEIVQVFQGEGGTLESLLGRTASITQTLANRDAVIGELLDNLDYVLDHIADRDQQLTNLIRSFRTLVGGPQGRPPGDPGLARRHLRPLRRDRGPAQGHPGAVRRGHQAAAPLRRQRRPQQGRARPGAPGAADQADEDRADRHLRLLVQLLPLRLPGPGEAARQRHGPDRLHRRRREV